MIAPAPAAGLTAVVPKQSSSAEAALDPTVPVDVTRTGLSRGPVDHDVVAV